MATVDAELRIGFIEKFVGLVGRFITACTAVGEQWRARVTLTRSHSASLGDERLIVLDRSPTGHELDELALGRGAVPDRDDAAVTHDGDLVDDPWKLLQTVGYIQKCRASGTQPLDDVEKVLRLHR